MSSLTSVHNGKVRDRKRGLPLAIWPGEPFFCALSFPSPSRIREIIYICDMKL